MASTRNKNTRGNYALELNRSIHTQDYLLNKEYGVAKQTNQPGNGLGGAHLPRQEMSANPIEIESFLRGIGSTNLTKSVQILEPELKCNPQLDLFRYPSVIVPEKFQAQTDQRPLGR
jgi:hypothetical protein